MQAACPAVSSYAWRGLAAKCAEDPEILQDQGFGNLHELGWENAATMYRMIASLAEGWAQRRDLGIVLVSCPAVSNAI